MPALWLGKEPKYVSQDTVTPYAEVAFGVEFFERVDLISRAIDAGDLRQPVRPLDFVKWADQQELAVPERLRTAVLAAGEQTRPDTVVALERALGQIAQLQQRISELETLVKEPGARERRSMTVLIGAMAVDKYGFDPSLGRQGATSQIVSAVEKMGLSIDEKTVLKQLRTAAEAIREELSLRMGCRNSD